MPSVMYCETEAKPSFDPAACQKADHTLRYAGLVVDPPPPFLVPRETSAGEWKRLRAELERPRLERATIRELFEELKARLEASQWEFRRADLARIMRGLPDKDLDYRTVE